MGGWVGGWEDKGGVWAYETYEVKNKREKFTLSFTSPEKDFFLYL
jgi:hypothetical protein